MTCGNIVYYPDENTEIIYYQDSDRAYPIHTHANHITIGYVLKGAVHIAVDGQENAYHAGDSFCILPDIPHAMKPAEDKPYSMVSVCIAADKMSDGQGSQIHYAKQLKRLILESPENAFPIKDMAQNIGVSPYHMIRRFKVECGLTPHQFQIQCRIRKAQKMLDKGKSVVEAAYDTGFCDQSHFDRCFYKIVRMTPSEYKQSVRL